MSIVTTIVHKAKSRFFCTQIANRSFSKQLFGVCKWLICCKKTSLPTTYLLWENFSSYYLSALPASWCFLWLFYFQSYRHTPWHWQTNPILTCWLPWFVFIFCPWLILSGVWAGTYQCYFEVPSPWPAWLITSSWLFRQPSADSVLNCSWQSAVWFLPISIETCCH